jgi:hypothetical protein
MSRIFHRPMFRIGGSAGGITSGLRRGYAAAGSVAPVPPEEEMPGDMEEGQNTGEIFETQDTAVEESTPSGNTMDTMLQNMMTDFPEPPKSSAGSDFLMNLGLNLMSGPSTGSLFGNIGEAGKEPMKQLQSQKYADKMAKYKHGMQKKQFMLDAYSKLNKDERLKLEKEIDFWMSEAGGKKSRAEALDIVMFRKPKNPKDIEREDMLRQQDELALELQNIRTGLGDKFTTLDDKDAMQIKRAKDFARENNLGFDLNASIIIDRASWSDFKGAIGEDENITLTEKNVGNFTDGNVYVDIVTGNIYEKQGVNLIKRN